MTIRKKKEFQKVPFKTGLGLSNKIFENISLQQKVLYNTQDHRNFAINRFWKTKGRTKKSFELCETLSFVFVLQR